MALIKTLTYEVLDLDGKIKPNSSISVNLKNCETGAKHLLHKTLIIQSTQRRQGTVSCKTRSEVKGGGKKPWKQKGTGRARSGSANSPLWRGGGVAFGPKPKTSTKKINNKEKKLALTTALYCAAHKTIVVEDNFVEIEKPSTKNFIAKVNKLNVIETSFKTLIITHKATPNTILSIRNLPNFQILSLENLALKQVLSAKKIIMTEQALSKLNTL
jgi:large subunit ribosomal protein L4